MADQIAAVDAHNPMASRMAKVFSRWRSWGGRQSAMREVIEGLATADLSANTAEVVAMLRT